MKTKLGSLWRALARRRAVRSEIEEEFELHVQLRAEDLVRAGVAPAEAARQARLEFGSRDRFQEEGVEARGTRRLEELWQDARFAGRLFRRAPGFTAVALLTLAIGIGATAAIFSVVDAALLRPLPYGDPSGLVSIWSRFVPESGSDHEFMSLSVPEYQDYTRARAGIADAAAYVTPEVTVAGGDARPDRVEVALATANLFDVLQTPPAFGRGFRAGEDMPGAPCVVVIAHGVATDYFGQPAAALGKTLQLSGEPCQVVGVMAPGFFFPEEDIRLWRPLALAANAELAADRGSHWIGAVGRLEAGLDIEQAEAKIAPLMSAWRAEHEHHLGHFVVLRSFREEVVANTRSTLIVLFGAVTLVLVIICANLGSLLLTRAEARQREVSVRLALGAGRARLVRQLLTESLLLSLLGGALAVAVAVVLLKTLLATAGGALALTESVTLNGRVLAFTALVAVVAGAAFGVLPALHLPARAGEALRSARTVGAARGSAPLRSALVIAEIALTMIVVSAAAILVRSYDQLRSVELGIERSDVLVFDVTLAAAHYPESPRITAFYQALRGEVAGLPGVEAAGLVSDLPLRSLPGMDSFKIEGRPEPGPGDESYDGGYFMATPGYFEAMGIPLRRGRLFEDGDVAGKMPVVVIDEEAARRYWPDSDPIGQRIQYYDDDAPWLTVIGVVGSVRYEAVANQPRPAIFAAHAQAPRSGFYTGRSMTLALRASGTPESYVTRIRDIVHRLDPTVPITDVATVSDVVSRSIGRPRLASGMMSLFGLAALLLGALGVYGVLAYQVRARTREIGIRMALGANSRAVRRMVLRRGVTLAAFGVATGLAGSLALSDFLEGMLYQVQPNDPVTLAAVAVFLTLIAIAASALPAQTATRIDPAAAVRSG